MVFRAATKDQNIPCPRTLIMVDPHDFLTRDTHSDTHRSKKTWCKPFRTTTSREPKPSPQSLSPLPIIRCTGGFPLFFSRRMRVRQPASKQSLGCLTRIFGGPRLAVKL